MIYYSILSLVFSVLPLQAEEPQTETPLQPKRILPHDREDGFTDVIVLPSREIKNFDMIEKTQQKYISKLHPDYRAVLSMYVKDKKNRYIEIISCVNYENETVQVYFDMGEVYKKLKTKDKETKKKIEELEKAYTSLQ